MDISDSLIVNHESVSPLFVSSHYVPRRGKRKKPASPGNQIDALNSQTQYEVTQAEEDVSNTTMPFTSSKVFILLSKGFYVGAYFDPEIGSLTLMEPLKSLIDDEHIFNSIVSRFDPESIVCNSNVAAKIETLELEDVPTLEVKTWNEFQANHGEEFIHKFIDQLGKSECHLNMLDTLCQLMVIDEYPLYCQLMAALRLSFESLMTGQHIKQIPEVITTIAVISLDEFVGINMDSMYALSIVKPEGKRNDIMTLLTFLSKTSSKIGGLTMKKYILRPSCNIDVINERLDTVEFIVNEMGSKSLNTVPTRLTFCLQCISNITKTLQCLRMGNFDPSIWKQLRKYSINVLKINEIIEMNHRLIEFPAFARYASLCDTQLARKVHCKLDEILDFDSDPNDVSIKPGVDVSLDECLLQYSRMEITLDKVALSISNQMGMPILIGYFPQMGYLAFSEEGEISVNGFELIFKTGNTAYYKTPQMIEMDNKFGDIALIIGDKQSEILFQLKERIMPLTDNFIQLYPIIGEIDVLVTFAKVSFNNKFCKPKMTVNEDLEIEDGFNPLIQVKDYIPNSFTMEKNKVFVLTGPNFSGKSTLLVQIGIIVFLCHIGCFVPANRAQIGIVNSILTRIASLETVSRNQSTFMRDCVQMGKCINKLKPRSLVLIDEFGKGTDIIDGQAMLSSVINYYTDAITDSNFSPRVFIATHMIEIFKSGFVDESKISHYQMAVVTTKNIRTPSTAVMYLYRLKEGVSNNSLGIYCMEKSGVDTETVKRAMEIQENLSRKNILNYGVKGSAIESAIAKILEIGLAERVREENISINNKTIRSFAASIRYEIRLILMEVQNKS